MLRYLFLRLYSLVFPRRLSELIANNPLNRVYYDSNKEKLFGLNPIIFYSLKYDFTSTRHARSMSFLRYAD